jgi:Tol biopolymer transport system component
VSPDGKRLGFHDMDTVNMDAWIYDLDRAALVRVTFHPLQDGHPVWSPDGKLIAFWSRQAGGVPNVYVRSADLTGADRRLTTGPNDQQPATWADGGKLLVFRERSRQTGLDIGVVPVDGGQPPRLIIRSESDETNPAVSPDGRWIAYQSNLSGRWEVYVQPFPDLAGRWQLSTQGGATPQWHPNGRELFYRHGDAMMSVPVDTTGSGFSHGSPQHLFAGSYVGEHDEDGRQYAIAPDGRFLMMKEAPRRPTEIIVIVNWAGELRARAAR